MTAFLRRYSLALRWIAFAVIAVVIVNQLEDANDRLSEQARKGRRENRQATQRNAVLLEELRCLQGGMRRDVDLILATLKELARREGIPTEDLPTREELRQRLEGIVIPSESDGGDEPDDPPTSSPTTRPTSSPTTRPTKSPRPTPTKDPVEKLVECVESGEILDCVEPIAKRIDKVKCRARGANQMRGASR